jgi:MraZ protein
MFRGIFQNTIDSKGRTSMPARFRDVFLESFGDEKFIITNSIPVNLGNDVFCRGLTVYPFKEWLAIEERVDKGEGLTPTELNSIKRLIIAPATECVADRQGRVLLPTNLRSYAALERDIVFVGMRKKIEIWDLEAWNKVFGQAEKDIPSGTLASAALGL